jgi:Rap1a immunity proteins
MAWKTISLGVTVILLGALLSVTPCHAFVPGTDLLRACTTTLRHVDKGYVGYTGEDLVDYGWCGGYLNGLVEGYALAIPYGEPLPFCLPSDGTPEQLMRVVVKYLRENPETLHHWRQLVALRALQHAFPCGSTTTPSPQPTHWTRLHHCGHMWELAVPHLPSRMIDFKGLARDQFYTSS